MFNDIYHYFHHKTHKIIPLIFGIIIFHEMLVIIDTNIFIQILHNISDIIHTKNILQKHNILNNEQIYKRMISVKWFINYEVQKNINFYDTIITIILSFILNNIVLVFHCNIIIYQYNIIIIYRYNINKSFTNITLILYHYPSIFSH